MSANIYDPVQKKLIPYAGSGASTSEIIADYDEETKNMIFMCQVSSPARYNDGNIDFT